MKSRSIGESLLRLFSAPSIPNEVICAASAPSYQVLGSLSISRRPFVTHRVLRQESSDTAAEPPTSSPYVTDIPPPKLSSPDVSSATSRLPSPRVLKRDAERERNQTLHDLTEGLLDQTLKPANPRGVIPRRVSDTITGGGEIASQVTNSLATFQERFSQSPYSNIRNKQGKIAGMMLSRTGVDVLKTKPRAVRTVKPRPQLGRCVEIFKDTSSKVKDLGSAIRILSIVLRSNNVLYDKKRQRFHERPGLKRKRLSSERWRKRFKVGFQAMVQKVVHMNRQGW